MTERAGEHRPTALEPGHRLGAYDILAPIGKGGMGEVYRARDTKLERDVAIKVLPEEFARDEERLRRFRREAKILASLNHPNIASIFGLDQDSSTHYLVLELVEGETLADRIARGSIPIDEALDIAVKIAEALEEAHEQGIIHRDLKPANIKLTPDDKVKVLDFGLAKALVDETPDADGSMSPTITRDATRVGAILGTAAYMSPEQARGKQVDKRTDIFAFGAVLYEMLTGKKAFPGEDISEVLAAVIKSEPDWESIPAIPPRLRALLARCTRKDPKRRQHDVADARIELEEIAAELENPNLETRRKPAPSRTAAWLLALVATAAITAVVVRFLAPGNITPVPDIQSDIRLRQLTGRPANDTLHSASLSPDGESLAFATENGLFLQLVATGEEQQIPLPEGLQIHEVDWLGGGSTLIFSAAFGGDIGLYKTSIFGATPTKLSDNAWRAAVSPDGTRIAYLQNLPSNVVRVMNADGGNTRTLAKLEGDDSFWEIAWSPDARWLLIGRWGGSISPFDTVLEAMDVETGEVHPVISDPRFFQNWRGFLPFIWAPDGRLIFALRETPPNELSSNLWQVEIDPETASLLGEPVRLTQLPSFNPKDLSQTTDGRSLSFLLERNQNDIVVADLASDTSIKEVRYVTADEREDYVLGWGPDHQTLYFASTRTGDWGLFRVDIDGPGQPQFIAPKGVGTHFFEVSPDGRSMMFWAGLELKRVPSKGGPTENILTAAEWPGLSCANDRVRCLVGEKSDDGRHYTLYGFDLKKGKGDEVLRFPNESTFTNWDLSPYGSMVVVGGNNDRLRIFDLQTKEETVLKIEGWHYGEFPAWAADGRGIYVDGGPVSRGRLRKGLLYISLDGEVQSLSQSWNEWITHVVPAIDGKHLAFSSQRFSANVWMIEDF